jgi:hypothetical protein
MGLVTALDTDHPRDFFLFVANDNDFMTQRGFLAGAPYRDASGVDLDTMFLVFRVTLAPPPIWAPCRLADPAYAARRMDRQATISCILTLGNRGAACLFRPAGFWASAQRRGGQRPAHVTFYPDGPGSLQWYQTKALAGWYPVFHRKCGTRHQPKGEQSAKSTK